MFINNVDNIMTNQNALNTRIFKNSINDHELTHIEQRSRGIKNKALTVNIHNYFYPKKKLYEILFSIANRRMKEKPV